MKKLRAKSEEKHSSFKRSRPSISGQFFGQFLGQSLIKFRGQFLRNSRGQFGGQFCGMFLVKVKKREAF